MIFMISYDTTPFLQPQVELNTKDLDLSLHFKF